jgi:hypothetical protein
MLFLEQHLLLPETQVIQTKIYIEQQQIDNANMTFKQL